MHCTYQKRERENALHDILVSKFFEVIHLLLPVCSLKLGGSRAVLGRKWGRADRHKIKWLSSRDMDTWLNRMIENSILALMNSNLVLEVDFWLYFIVYFRSVFLVPHL